MLLLQVILHRHLLHAILEDLVLLHRECQHSKTWTDNAVHAGHALTLLACACAELGCRLVVVLGAKRQIDNYLRMRGLEQHMVKGYRVTDESAMLAAMEAAGTSRMLVEAQLSKVWDSLSQLWWQCHRAPASIQPCRSMQLLLS